MRGLNKLKSKEEMAEHKVNLAKMMYIYREKNEEQPDDEIKKQALLEALCGTKIWTEIYLEDNPFVYITPRK